MSSSPPPLAVVVGAGVMGTAIARRLSESHRLVLADRNSSQLAQLTQTLQEEGLSSIGTECDVLDSASLARVTETVRKAGGFQSLVHVVGLSPGMADGPTVLRVNLLGPTLVLDAFADLLQVGTVAVIVSSVG